MKKILNFAPRYAITEEGKVYDIVKQRWLAISLNHNRNDQRVVQLACPTDNPKRTVRKVFYVDTLLKKYFPQ